MGKSFSILVVDDNRAMASSLRDVLELKGFTVYATNSGREALMLLHDHPVDVMVTDVIMPEMNGVELFRETKKAFPKLTILFMTAYSADDLIQEGMREGIRMVLNKPLDIGLLLSILRTIEERVN